MKKRFCAVLLVLVLFLGGCSALNGHNEPKSTNQPMPVPSENALLDGPALASDHGKGTMIAPARSKEDMEPVYTDAVYIQDLSSATGHIFCPDRVYSFSNEYRYSFDPSLSEEELLAEMEAYVDLLAAQPDFEVIRPFGSAGGGYDDIYFACLNYTGTQARMEEDKTCWYWDDRVIHIEVLFEGDTYGSCAYVEADDNLRYLDLGLRTPDGAERLSSGQISGERVGDAYYLNQGVYYNASDRKLSASSGEAGLLIDGKSCTANAGLYTDYGRDYIVISGHQQDEEIKLMLSEDSALTGEVYGLDALRQNEGSFTTPCIRVSCDNDNFRADASARPDREITEATVRILHWDKSRQNDTVIYFHMRAEVYGIVHEYEGLAAGTWEGAEAKPSGPVLDKKDCLACGGSGNCHTCGGSGRVKNSMAGTGKWVEQDCTSCGGSGDCRDCHGSGKR